MNLTSTTSYLRLVVVLISAFLLAACIAKEDSVVTADSASGQSASSQSASGQSAAVEPVFDMSSWTSIIGDECRSFFDGCNHCFREPGKMAACTRKACLTYQQPRCLDEEAAAESAATARRVDYACDAASSFSVSYHEFVQDDQRVRLKESEIMFSDHQQHTVYRLQRTPSASGEQYVDSAGFKFFAKGDEALVMKQDSHLYSGCKIKL
jgi:hypothetical protein